jgi:hypothetical protein
MPPAAVEPCASGLRRLCPTPAAFREKFDAALPFRTPISRLLLLLLLLR